MATIYDVARLAGVSAKTVSRVLNSDGPVRAPTRAAVEAAMRELAFVPSNAARMMRSAKSGLIGLITGAITTSPDPTKSGLPDILIVQGIQQAVARAGMTLMIADTGGRFDKVPHLVQTFLRHRVEGLIYVAEHHQKVALPPVPPATPLVLANCFDGIGTPAVIPDDRRGQDMLTTRLIAAGHRRIGFLTLRDGMVAADLRLKGYRDALAKAGIGYEPAIVLPCDFDGLHAESELLWDTIDGMLRLDQPPSVLLCGNDRMALRVYGILRSRGVRVPDDMCVAGFDNHRVIAETLFPSLTTVELPYAAIGVRAAERLLGLIDGTSNGDAAPTLVTGPVYWRDSVTDRRVSHIHQLKTVKEE